MSRRKQANPKSLKASIDNLKQLIDEKTQLALTKVVADECGVALKTDDKNDCSIGAGKAHKMNDEQKLLAIYLANQKNEIENDIVKIVEGNDNDAAHSQQKPNSNSVTTKSQHGSEPSDEKQLLTSESFLKNMTNKQLKSFDIRKQSPSSKVLVESNDLNDENKNKPRSQRSSSSSSSSSDDRSRSTLVLATNPQRSRSRSTSSEQDGSLFTNKNTSLNTTTHLENKSNTEDATIDSDENVNVDSDSTDDEIETTTAITTPLTNNRVHTNTKPLAKNGADHQANKNSNSTATSQQENEQPTFVKKNKRQRYHQGALNNSANTSSIIVNGKRYYRLIFTCENCGIRYSDQSALNTHKENYCVKRNQNASEAAQSSSSSSASYTSENSQSSSSSSSPSPSSTPLNPSPATSPALNTTHSRSVSPMVNRQTAKSSELKPQHQTSNAVGESAASDVQLCKSVIFQCNYCLFQTDKKNIMNRHSRVHLAQKRKQMEEASSAASTQTGQETPADMMWSQVSSSTTGNNGVDNKNDKSKSYCKDCDIQFSSIKTYQHHRDNYCQKYKTIESVVPIEVTNTNAKTTAATSEPSAPKIAANSIQTAKKSLEPAVRIKKTIDVTQPSPPNARTNFQISNLIAPAELPQRQLTPGGAGQFLNPANGYPVHLSSPSGLIPPVVKPIQSVLPPEAVRMGDTVYLPAFKLNNLIDSSNGKDQFQGKGHKLPMVANALGLSRGSFIGPREEETDERTTKMMRLGDGLEVEPLDLSLKTDRNAMKPNKLVKFDHPVSAARPPLAFSVNPHGSLPFVPPVRIKTPNESSSILAKGQLANQMLGQTLNAYQILSTLSLVQQMQQQQQQQQQLQQQPHQSPIAQNKIYHCTNCQQLFVKYKLFKRHQCTRKDEDDEDDDDETDHEQDEEPKKPNDNQTWSKFDESRRLNVDNSRVKSSTPPDSNSTSDGSTSSSSSSSSPQSEYSRCLPSLNQPSKVGSKTTIVKAQPQAEMSKSGSTDSASGLLKHPLVKKTLTELYGKDYELLNIEDDSNLIELKQLANASGGSGSMAKNFFMCTACGYRGNTARGVKQHGKMHLTDREHFGIINVTSTHPFLVYNTLCDTDLQSSLPSFNSPVKRQFANDDETDSNHFKHPNDDEIHSDHVDDDDDDSQSSQPVSKKVRLNGGAKLPLKNQPDSNSIINNNKNNIDNTKNDLNKSQKFCHKCNTQFQHVNNFLAHVKYYCKDN